ncbi:MAG: hypothetical protein VR78_03700 [Hoeflea sp. BRH_c9]|nr:MAG: hypothetical protein VR78_03700 [Hoeflea sp. BRH_c9]
MPLEGFEFLVRLLVDLSCLVQMLQLAKPNGVEFDPFSLQQDGLAEPEIGGGRGQVSDIFMVSAVIVMFDELRHLCPKVDSSKPSRIGSGAVSMIPDLLSEE